MSRQTWRMVAADQATASVAARVEVARQAQKTDAEQSLKGLLMERTATINLKPELEIFADDVKCAHGATVGELRHERLSAHPYQRAQPAAGRGRGGKPPLQPQPLHLHGFIHARCDGQRGRLFPLHLSPGFRRGALTRASLGVRA